MNFKEHHYAYLTKSIDLSLLEYEALGFSLVSEIYKIETQKVKVCFIKCNSDVLIELVEPAVDNSTLINLYDKGVRFYHTAFLVKDIYESISYLEAKGFLRMKMFESEAFGGRLCCFMVTKDKNLIELIER
jgi:hypothetical protein